ncbi:hypothetical protein SASPL_106198 [Salvia splendens]|uniref:Pre-mRNA-processing factor 39 n=1 Tax=Salvia splendens TaxID=180675 RepID=A0A8X8YMT9_SALSN|nr:hypothetical protein SASPL_106198 [Salvia splendens]
MGDGQTMTEQASSVAQNVASVNASDDTGSILPETENAAPGGITGEIVSSSSGVNADAGSTHVVLENVSQQETPVTMAYDAGENLTGLANSSANSTQVSVYDASLGNGDSMTRDGAASIISDNGVASADLTGSAAMHQPSDGSALSAEEERLWSIVTTNSLDFDAWTTLIDETERTSEGNISKIRKVYDTFLAEFPLCYGYWKKYADHEARLSSVDKVAEIYERAVQGVTYSVDMWLHYCVFAIGTYGDADTIRRLFERALAYVGTDYLCFPLWDKYIEFKELVASRPLSELRTAEEAPVIADTDSQENEGEVPPDAAEQSSTAVNASLKDAEELEKYIAIREEMYKKAKEFDFKIIGFETAIRRPYFHVRPLNVAELENWHNYLDFTEGGDDFNKVVKLYERCLIACARYPEFWIRYVLCMEASGSMELVENALARATLVFVKRQPEIHLFAARFKEQHGDISGARAAYQHVHTGIAPGLLEAIIKHANMENRLGKLEDACSLYEQAIAIEKGKEHSQALALLFAQYSRFIFLVSGNVEKAREILILGVESAPLSKPFLEAMIHLESVLPLPKQIDYLDSLVEKFIVPSPDNPSIASVDDREELSSIFLEFLDLFGDAMSVKKADYRHSKLFLNHRSTSVSKKRHAEDYLASDRTKLAKSLVPTSVPSVQGAYPSTQNQWPAGYGVQPQTWPQAPQTQAQQWNYAQQAAYTGYGASYAHPQASVPVPQNTAYGTYPQTYQAQPAYAQPAVAATPVQQAPTAAAAPSAAYYTGYY